MNTSTSTRSYVEEVAHHLDDLPETERRELLEDLEQHIAEVAAEAEGTLDELLGGPEAYALELRASAGLPPREDDGASFAHRLMLSGPTQLARRALDAGPARAVRSFLPQLRPAWWVGRGYLAVLLLNEWLFDGWYSWALVIPVPRLNGSTILGLVAIAAAIWASVALGMRSPEDRRARITSWAANSLAVLLLLTVVAQYPNLTYYGRSMPAAPVEYAAQADLPPWLHHPDGSEISNICAYDSSLRPLDRVLLYDQDGRPIDNTVPVEPFVDVWMDPSQGAIDAVDPVPERVIGNAYPRPHTVDPRTGRLVPFECPTIHPTEDAGEADPEAVGEEDVEAVPEDVAQE